MKLSSELIGRGLLVLALTGYAVGCGDDTSGEKDAGSDASAGTGGTGANGGTGAAGSAGDGGQECGAPQDIPEQCVACSAERDAAATAMCDATCISLLECAAGAMCSDATCLMACCGDFLGGLNGLLAVYGQDGMGPLASCIQDMCPTGDGGTDDAGN